MPLRPQHRKHRRRQPDLFRQVAEGFDPAGGADAGGAAAVAQLPSGAENRRARRCIDAGAQPSVPALAAGLPHRRQPATLFRLPLALRQPEQVPYIAPHFIEQLRQQTQQLVQRDTRVDTTLDAGLQRLVERQVNAFIARNRSRGIQNAAVLLVDSRDMGVRALVGSADYYNRPIQGQVNGTNAKRSPGSTLKPFIYALGMEQGVLHPMTILKDVPSSFGAYAPENFDRRFLGPVTATDALNFSRNIPAVYVASQLRQPTFYQFCV